ncbi:unnamed protein product [Camellia sinensis]
MAPKIQRLVTPLTLQTMQARITDKKKRIAKAKEEARIEEEGDVATAFTLARTLSNIPISRGGPTRAILLW